MEAYLNQVMEGFDVSTSPATNMGAPFTIDDNVDSVIVQNNPEEDVQLSPEETASLESLINEFPSESVGNYTDILTAVESLLNF